MLNPDHATTLLPSLHPLEHPRRALAAHDGEPMPSIARLLASAAGHNVAA
jgi:hypothetical protein